MTRAGDAVFEIAVFRSLAESFWTALSESAAEFGVKHERPSVAGAGESASRLCLRYTDHQHPLQSFLQLLTVLRSRHPLGHGVDAGVRQPEDSSSNLSQEPKSGTLSGVVMQDVRYLALSS